jgi:outer membrane protein assembly factor BamE (lipoprotein component of BamABCDE complex)
MRRTPTPTAWTRLALAAAGATLLLAACSTEVTVRGNLPDPDAMSQVQIGASSRQQVAEILGSPSTISSFQDRTWYYIGQKQTQVAFLDPEVLERTVFVVAFDDAGMVKETAHYTLEDGIIIDPVTRETPTEGRELTVLQQIFGNLGKFPTSQQ